MRKKWVISVNSYYLKNHIYLIEIVIAIILNVAAEIIVHFRSPRGVVDKRYALCHKPSRPSTGFYPWKSHIKFRNKQMDPLPLEKMNRPM